MIIIVEGVFFVLGGRGIILISQGGFGGVVGIKARCVKEFESVEG